MNGIIAASRLPVIDANVKKLIENALSDNTLRALASDLRHYLNSGKTIPAQPEQIAEYLSENAGKLSIATLQRRLITLGRAHTMQGYENPVATDIVKLTMRGVRRLYGVPQKQVAPILKDDLIVMLSHIPATTKGKRDRALLLLGFCGALRRSELVAVRVEDMEINSSGIILTIPRSKTDQLGIGRKIGIPRARGQICPVTAVTDWLSHSGAKTGELFRNVVKGGNAIGNKLSTRSVANIIKSYAKKAGLRSDRYSGHSLRTGLATSAAQQGISSWIIRKQTGHKSDAMLSRYIRDGDLFTNNAASIF